MKDFDAFFQAEQDAQEESLGTSLAIGRTLNADEEAKKRKTAQQLGVPVSIAPTGQEANAELHKQKFSAESIIKQAPRTAAWLAKDPSNAAVTGLDVDQLMRMERATLLAPPKTDKSIAGGLWTSFIENFKQQAAGREMLSADIEAQKLEAFRRGPAWARNPMEHEVPEWARDPISEAMASIRYKAPKGIMGEPTISEQRMAPSIARFNTALEDYRASAARDREATPEFDTTVGRWVYGGGSSILQTLPGMAASFLNPGLGAATFYENTMAQSYAKYRERGANPLTATTGANVEGLSEGVLNYVPMKFVVDKIGRIGLGEFMAGTLGRELPTELVQSMVEVITDTAIANPDKTWAQLRSELPDVIGQTATAVFMTGGLFGGIDVALKHGTGSLARAEAEQRDKQSKTQRAETTFNALSAFSQVAADNPLRTNSPEAFHDFVESMSDDQTVSEVFVDGKTLSDSLGQAGVSMAEVQRKMPDVATQLQEAAATDGMVRISAADYATYLAGTEVDKALLPHLRTDAAGMTYAEAQTFAQSQAEEYKQQAEKIMADNAKDEAFATSVATVRDRIVKQFETAGRYTESVNKANAEPITNFYIVQAQRLGITPAELFDRVPLNVNAESLIGPHLDQARAPATAEDFTPGNVKNILDRGNWAMLTAENPNAQQLSPEENAVRMDQLRAALTAQGIEFKEAKGKYGNEENSLLLLGVTSEQAQAIGKQFGQESVLTPQGLVYQDGTVNPAVGVNEFTTAPEDFYSVIPETGAHFSVDINWDQRVSLDTLGQAAIVGKLTDGSVLPPVGTGQEGSIAVAAIHFSQSSQKSLQGGFYGTGLAGAEAKRLGADPRLKKRIYFYVPEGNGVAPEAGVGAVAHGAVLNNLYDAGADHLGLWRNNTDKSKFESSVLDQEFSGYYMPGSFGTQGAAVLLGDATDGVKTRVLGTADRANELLGPLDSTPGVGTAARDLAVEIAQNKALPSGSQTLAEWQKAIEQADPVLYSRIAKTGAFEQKVEGALYKDELARMVLNSATFGQATAQTETPAFKKWFGDSKVVDAEGKPLVVYHGAPSGFEGEGFTYDAKGVNDYGDSDMGFWFASAEVANRFAGDDDGATVLPVYLVLQSPKVLRGAEFVKMLDTKYIADWKRYKAQAVRDGYDGIIIKTDDAARASFYHDQFLSDNYVAFHPEQIKSAIGNRGTFDAKEANILFQSAVQTEEQQVEQDSLKMVTEQLEDLKRQYIEANTHDGLLTIDVDAARELFPAYVKDRARFAAAVHEASSTVAKAVYADEIRKETVAGKNPDVVFMAGGTGSGKGSTREISTLGAQLKKAHLVYDSTLASFDSAVARIDLALQEGKNAIINFVLRDPIAALTQGSLPRAERSGRTVPLREHARTHEQAPQVVAKLAKHYAGNDHVVINVISNQGTLDDIALVGIDALSEAKYTNLEPRLLAALNEEYQNGRISKETYEGSLGLQRTGQTTGPGNGAVGEGGAQEGTLQQARRAQFDPARLTITLLSGADLSSVIHESAHFYLEALTRMSAMPEAPAELLADLDKALVWGGVAGDTSEARLANWRGMSLDEQRPLHEQWAQSYERWILEGKAPATEMQSLFARFRAWMLNVYKSVEQFLQQNPGAGKLDDEVRGVFSRMLASQEAVAYAEQMRGYGPLFQSANEAGVPERSFLAYTKLGEEATRDAQIEMEQRSLRDIRWLSNAKDKAIRALQKEADSLRTDIKAQVTKEIMAEPINQARTFLKTGEVLDPATGEMVKALEGFKLDSEAVKAMYPETELARPDTSKLRGLTSKEGLHPDMVAKMFGFPSGDALVRELISGENAKDKIEGFTDQRMLEEHGELVDSRAVERAAEAAIHNDARARFLATGLKILTKSTVPVNTLAKAAKLAAEQNVAAKKVRDLRPGQYTAAETRANKEALKLAPTDPKAAAQAQRAALLNNRLARATTDAIDEIKMALRYLKKFETKGMRQNLDLDYVEQIDSLLKPFDLSTGVPLADIDKRASLLAFVAEQEALGFQPAIDAETIDKAKLKHYKDMTVEEVRGLVDTIKQVEHLGRLKKRLLTAKDAREFATRMAEADASIRMNANRTVKERATATDVVGKVAQFGRWLAASHRKFASLIREMDGGKDGGVMWDLLSRAMNEAGDKETAMKAEASAELSRIFEPIQAIIRSENVAGNLYTRKKQIPGTNISMTHEERIMFAMNWGNEGNRQRLLDGGLTGKRALSAQEARAILDTLTKPEWDFVQSVLDYVGSYRAQIAEQERQLTGIEPKWIEPAPIDTKFGTYPGGYFPAKYDTNLSTRSDSLEAVTNLRLGMKGAFGAAATRNGYTKERANAVIGRPLLLNFGVVSRHVNEVVHRLSWQGWLTDANRTLRALDAPIREHYGPEVLRELRDTVNDIASGDVAAATPLEQGLNHLRIGSTIVGLGWRVTTALLQPTGLAQSWVRVGGKWMATGVADFIKAPLESGQFVNEKSALMRDRGRTMYREINEVMNVVRAGEKVDAIHASFFSFIGKMQRMVDIPTWLGAYEKALASMKLENTSTEAERKAIDERAVALADQAVIDSQSGGQLKDLAKIQRGSPALKLFTNFYSYFSATYNLNAEIVRRTHFDSPSEIGLMAVDLLILNTVPALFSFALRELLKGNCGDDVQCLAGNYAREQANYMFGQMVPLREVGSAVEVVMGGQGFGYTGPAGLRFFNDLYKLSQQAAQGEADMALFKAANSVAGTLLHYPAGQVNNTLEGMLAVENGEVEGAAILPALIAGPRRQ